MNDSSTGIAAKCGRARLADAAAILTIASLSPRAAAPRPPRQAGSRAGDSGRGFTGGSGLAGRHGVTQALGVRTTNGEPAREPGAGARTGGALDGERSPGRPPVGLVTGGRSAGPDLAASPFDDAFSIIDRDGTYLKSWAAKGSGNGDGELRLVGEGNGFGDVAFDRMAASTSRTSGTPGSSSSRRTGSS